MRHYLLDSAVLTAYLYERSRAIQLVEPWLAQREAATSILVSGEIVEHLLGRTDFRERRSQLRRLLREVVPHFLTPRIMERYAEIRRQLRPPFGPGLIGDVDTLIAATAIERRLLLVTTDSDFRRVPDLRTVSVDRNTLATR